MGTIMPQGELMRKAVAFVSEKLEEGMDLAKAIEEAAMCFNLGPKDSVFLDRFFKQEMEKDD